MSSDPQHVAVLGSGIIGVTTALRLVENGYRVVLFTPSLFDKSMCSYNAGAVWCPFLTGNTPASLIRKWAKRTYVELASYAHHSPNSGVTILPLRNYYTAGIDPLDREVLGVFALLKKDSLASHAVG